MKCAFWAGGSHKPAQNAINYPQNAIHPPRIPFSFRKTIAVLNPPTNFRVYASLPRHCQSSICLIRSETSRLNECKGEHSSQGFVYYTIEFWEGARWSGRICIRPKHIKHHSGRECVAFWSLFSVALVFSLRPSSYFSPWSFTPSNLQLSKTIRMVPIRNLHGCKGEYSSQGFVQPLNPGLNPCPWY